MNHPTVLTVTLPHDLSEFVQQQAARSGNDAASYVRLVLQAEQRRRTDEDLKALLREGLRSESSPMTGADWESIREEGLRRLASE